MYLILGGRRLKVKIVINNLLVVTIKSGSIIFNNIHIIQ